MKPKFLLVSIFVVVAGAVPSRASAVAQPGCNHVAVRREVEVPAGEVSLAAVLSGDTCPALAQSAAHVCLGAAPLAGSARVLEGETVRALLGKLHAGNDIGKFNITVPERVTIRRAGRDSACSKLAKNLAMLPAGSVSGADMEVQAAARMSVAACGAAGRIPEDAPLRVASTKWNAGLRAWDVSVQCPRRGDCVPFLVRVQKSDLRNFTLDLHRESNDPSLFRASETNLSARPNLVHAGEKVMLEWDASGIRITLPAVALDAGPLGAPVRARIEPSGRVLPAVVSDRGRMRTGS
jgi:hypothetical protein